MMTRKPHMLVIGAGLAGLNAALRLTETDNRVTLVSKGIGGLPFSLGTLDVLGYIGRDSVVVSFAVLEQLPDWRPYQRIRIESVARVVDWLVRRVPALYPEVTSVGQSQNSWLPTAVGAVRSSYIQPLTCRNAVLQDGMKLVVVGIAQFKDFPAALIADSLTRSERVQVSARAIEISLDARGLADVKGTDYMRVLDSDLQSMKRFAQQINAAAQLGETVLVPVVVGLKPETSQNFAAQVNHPVAEVSTPPPCVTGRRLNDALVDLLTETRVDTRNSATVTGVTSTDRVITAVTVVRAEDSDGTKVDIVVDAAGGFASDNLTRNSYIALHEAMSEPPLFTPPAVGKTGIHSINIRQKILVEQLLSSGIMVNEKMQALRPATEGSESDALAFENLYVIGEALGGTDPASKISGGGLALGSMFKACEAINAGKGELK